MGEIPALRMISPIEVPVGADERLPGQLLVHERIRSSSEMYVDRNGQSNECGGTKDRKAITWVLLKR